MESVVTQIAKAKILDETLDESDAPYKDSNVFILVNSRSGSCVGRNLIKKFDKMVSIKHQANTFTNFYIYDLYLKSDVEDCFKLVHELTENNIHARILIGGGDGTIQWVISSAVDFKIDFSRVAFGVLPIGTGNVFAGSIGWGNF
jgi:diacylglycerol kinase family enzyme